MEPQIKITEQIIIIVFHFGRGWERGGVDGFSCYFILLDLVGIFGISLVMEINDWWEPVSLKETGFHHLWTLPKKAIKTLYFHITTHNFRTNSTRHCSMKILKLKKFQDHWLQQKSQQKKKLVKPQIHMKNFPISHNCFSTGTIKIIMNNKCRTYEREKSHFGHFFTNN